MSQAPQFTPAEPKGNTLGVVGFVLSLLGLLCTGGMLSPIGLILSLIALRREPRGLAIAGVILGVLGLVGLVVLVGVVGLGFILVLFGIGAMVQAVSDAGTQMGGDTGAVIEAVMDYHEANKAVPASLDELSALPAEPADQWGNPLEYRVRGKEAWLVSAGEDGQTDTPDDLIFYADFREAFPDMSFSTRGESDDDGS